MKKPFTDSAKLKILLIGDSHAQDFYNGIIENGFLQNYQITTRYIPTRCQIYLSDNLYRFTKPNDQTLCRKSDNLKLANKQIQKSDIIILAASWRDWSAKALPATINNLHLSSKQRLFVIGGKSFGSIKPEKYTKLSRVDQLNLRNTISEKQAKINHFLSENINNDTFINVYKIICESTETCPIFTDSLELISLDGGHLTKAGARYIGRKLFHNSPLKNL